MSSIPPSEHATRLLEYYIRSLVERSGLRWTEANSADFDKLADLFDQAEAEPADTIPPYQAPIRSDRQTAELDYRDDPNFAHWRGRRAVEDDDVAVRRLVRR